MPQTTTETHFGGPRLCVLTCTPQATFTVKVTVDIWSTGHSLWASRHGGMGVGGPFLYLVRSQGCGFDPHAAHATGELFYGCFCISAPSLALCFLPHCGLPWPPKCLQRTFSLVDPPWGSVRLAWCAWVIFPGAQLRVPSRPVSGPKTAPK